MTVIVVTPRQRMTTYHLSYWLLHLFSLLLLSLLTTALLLSVDYQEKKQDIVYYRAANSDLNKALEVINNKALDDLVRLRTINLVVRRLNNYNESLMKMAGLQETLLSEEEEAVGLGGPADLGLETSPEESLADWSQNTSRELEATVFEQEKSFIQLKSFLEQQSELLSSTPSIKPVRGSVFLSSRFGYRISPFSKRRAFHNGVDLSGRRGMPVIATADGEVILAGWQKGYGRLVVIKHEFGYLTRYGHNDKLLVKKGDLVKRGDQIALMGSTGYSTGPHCHYEVVYNGRRMNPLNYILNWQ